MIFSIIILDSTEADDRGIALRGEHSMGLYTQLVRANYYLEIRGIPDDSKGY